MRLWVLAAILAIVLAGCGRGEEEFTAPTEQTEIVKDETEVTQAPPGDKE